MSRLKYAILTAAFMFAMALTFSCSRDSDENPFAQQYLYCVYPVEKTCVPGVVKECPQGGAPKDVCPAEFVEKAPSSSSGGRSSSSGGNNNDPFAGIPGWEYYKEILKYYDPDDRDQRCRNGVVEERCEVDGNEGWYNPLTHWCVSSGEDDCSPYDNSCVAPTRTSYLGTVERCGNELYVSSNDIMCERCGSTSYLTPSRYRRCQNGVVETKCGYDENEIWHNSETHYCDNHYEIIKPIELLERCGNIDIRYDDERCNNGVFEAKCNATWYDPITQSCDCGTPARSKQSCIAVRRVIAMLLSEP